MPTRAPTTHNVTNVYTNTRSHANANEHTCDLCNTTLPKDATLNQKQCSASSYSRSQYLPYQELSCLAPLVAPGASKPSKLLLQYPVELSIGVASLWCMPPSLELAFRGASASNTAFLAGLLCHGLARLPPLSDEGLVGVF